MLCVEFLQVQYINLSDVARVVKVVATVTVSHFSSAKVSPEWRMNPQKCPFPLYRGVTSLELTNTMIMWTFFWRQILCPLNGGVPWIEVS